MRRKNDTRGFSLVEVLMATGVLSFLTYFVMGILQTGTQGQKQLLAFDDARILTHNLSTLLSDPMACEKTFANVNPVAGTDVTNLLDKGGNLQYQTGLPYGNRSVKLGKITVGGTGKDDKFQINKWVPGSVGNTGMAFVSVEWIATAPGANKIGPEKMLRYFMLYVTEIDGANKIVKCTAQAGAAAPAEIGPGVPNYLALWNSNTTVKESTLYQDPTAPAGAPRLGVGTPTPKVTLDVNGGVKIGNQTTVTLCDAATEGTMRYNTTYHQMEYCGAKGMPLAYSWMGVEGPGAAKFWVVITGGTMGPSYNVSSVVETSPGVFKITFIKPMTTMQYVLAVSVGSGATSGFIPSYFPSQRLTTYVAVATWDMTLGQYNTPPEMTVAGYGD